MAQNPADVDALLQCKAEGSDLTVDALLKEKILVIGENIKIRRFARYEGVVTSYVHAGAASASSSSSTPPTISPPPTPSRPTPTTWPCRSPP